MRPRPSTAAIVLLTLALLVTARPTPAPGVDYRDEACFSPPPAPVLGGVPVRDCKRALIDAIKGAQFYIWTQQFEFDDPDFTAELGAAIGRGVQVAVMLDVANAGKAVSQRDALFSLPLDLATDDGNSTGAANSKVWMIDNLLITGSYNLTDAAALRNVENLVILHDPRLLNLYRLQFVSRWYGSRAKILKRVRYSGYLNFQP
jgi:phosphatidylserine/phosphatidylglycerophosphate/cardiolipin synthase-like enzyme